jgi:hypothetical protein
MPELVSSLQCSRLTWLLFDDSTIELFKVHVMISVKRRSVGQRMQARKCLFILQSWSYQKQSKNWSGMAS